MSMKTSGRRTTCGLLVDGKMKTVFLLKRTKVCEFSSPEKANFHVSERGRCDANRSVAMISRGVGHIPSDTNHLRARMRAYLDFLRNSTASTSNALTVATVPSRSTASDQRDDGNFLADSADVLSYDELKEWKAVQTQEDDFANTSAAVFCWLAAAFAQWLRFLV